MIFSGDCRLGRSYDLVYGVGLLITVLQSSVYPLVYSSVIRAGAKILGYCLGWSCVS